MVQIRGAALPRISPRSEAYHLQGVLSEHRLRHTIVRRFRQPHPTPVGQILPQPTAVIGVKMARQLGHQLKRDRHGARIAVAGGDTIDRTLFAQQTVEEIRPSGNASAEFMRIG